MNFLVKLIVATSLLLLQNKGLANFFWGAGVAWKTISLRPLVEEDTPSFGGYGLDIVTGIVWGGVFEGRLQFEAAKCQRGPADLYKGDIVVQSWGGELGVRVENSAFLGLFGGIMDYAVPSHHSHNEFVGKWSGPEMGVKLAGSWWARKSQMVEVGLKISQVTLVDQSANSDDERTLDTIALTMTYLLVGPKYF